MAGERVQRRLAAILAADIVGYSRLMDADETGTLARLKSLRDDVFDPTVARFGGRIFKLTGDGALVEFASAVDAVQAAVEVQRALERRNAALAEDDRQTLRIGVSLGDVIVEDDDLYGNGVNVAARLEAMAEPGGICISGTVHEQARTVGDIGFEDLGEQRVKNIDRPIQAFRVLLDPATAQRHGAEKPGPRPLRRLRAMAAGAGDARWKRPAIAAAVLVLLAAGATAWWEPWVTRVERASVERMVLPLPDKPSIAVLPFANLSGDKEQGNFASGLTVEIINNLTGFENLFVIARDSTNMFSGKGVEVKTVAEKLGVRYVLEGSLRRSGDTLRVTAQLIDAVRGRYLWAGKYDRQAQDMLKLQEEITREIVGRLLSEVAVAEFEKRARQQTTSRKAYALFLRGWNAFHQLNRDTNALAIRFFEQSIEADPNYARAHAFLAWARRNNAVLGWGDGPQDNLENALALAEKAVALGPDDSHTHRYLGAIKYQLGRLRDSIASYETAVALNPGAAESLSSYAMALALVGRNDEAIQAIEKALRLDPHPRIRIPMLAGIVHFNVKQFEKSAAAFERARRINPRSTGIGLAFQAAALAEAGKMAEARLARDAYLKISPGYSIEGHGRVLAAWPEEYRTTAIAGLRKAGYPERPPLKLPDKPSIAVLPFANMSGDKQQEYFSDGITEDIVTELSKVSGLFVIGHGSTSAYRGKAAEFRQIARDLGVRYIVEGSVRKHGGKVRITAKLIDASNGRHIWANQYDRALSDIFEIQDDVSGRIVATLAVTLAADERSRRVRKHVPKPEAYDLVLRGANVFVPPRPKNLAAARPLFERAIAIDPRYAMAYTWLAEVHGTRVAIEISRSPREELETSRRMALKAISLDPTSASPYISLARVHMLSGRFDEAVEEMEKAVRIEPGSARIQRYYSYFLARADRAAEGIGATELALRLSPFDPGVHSFAAATYFFAGRYAKSIAHFQRRETIQGRSTAAFEAMRAAAEIHTGKEAAARKTVQLILRKRPSYTVSTATKTLRSKNSEATERLSKALIRAGLPEAKADTAPRLSIVVLPFNNLSGDPKQDYLADGITDDLITNLSRIRDAFVISRGTSFTYKGKTVDPKAVARNLNVQHILEGTVRRAGDQVRINARLIDGSSGAHVWSQQFDRTNRNVFALQDEITGRIANVLRLELLEAEGRRLKTRAADNLEARDYALRAWAELWTKPYSRKTAYEAKRLLEKALQLDPDSALAWTGMARIYSIAATSGWGLTQTTEEAKKLLLEAARRAVELDPKSADAHRWLGYAYRFHGRPVEENFECETALKLNPNHDQAINCVALSKISIGRPSEAIELFKKSMRLNPRDPTPARIRFMLGMALLLSQRHEEAVATIKEGMAANPSYLPQHWVLASALGWLDRKEEATSVLARFSKIDKGRRDTIAKMRKHYDYIEKFEHALEGLRRAGMPEK